MTYADLTVLTAGFWTKGTFVTTGMVAAEDTINPATGKGAAVVSIGLQGALLSLDKSTGCSCSGDESGCDIGEGPHGSTS